MIVHGRRVVFSTCLVAFLIYLPFIRSSPPPAPAPPPDQLQINGAGATFPYPIYSKRFDDSHRLHPDIEVNSQFIGSGSVIRTPYCIGYVELIYALQNRLSYGPVENSSGVLAKADLTNVTDDFPVSITIASGKSACPISTFTWLLIPSKIDDGANSKLIMDVLRWKSGDGQEFAEPLSYSRLRRRLRART